MNTEKKVVLVVDDSLVVLERMIPMLEDTEGIEFVLHAGTYKEALGVLEDLKPDYILLDIHLPDESGLSLLKFVRQRYENILVFMMTNQATDQYRNVCHKLGARRFFDKSCDLGYIQEALIKECA